MQGRCLEERRPSPRSGSPGLPTPDHTTRSPACGALLPHDPSRLLLTGLGLLLLLLGLLLILGIDNPATQTLQQASVVQGYLANAGSMVGAGLVVVAALVSALRRSTDSAEPPAIDHYS